MTDLCGRCLINPNAVTLIRAKVSHADGSIDSLVCPDLRPRTIRDWAEGILLADEHVVFELDAWSGALIPVATWNGDPICDMHLWERRDAELRLGGMRR